MLETGIPSVYLRTKLYNDKKIADYQAEEKRFSNDIDTNYNPILNERICCDKKFTFKKEANDFGLSDVISKMKFTFKQSDSNFLLSEQEPSDHKFRRSSGLGSMLNDFDSLAPKKDYGYVDPQFYEYRLKGMTLDKLVQNKMMNQDQVYETKPDLLDPTNRAINLRELERVYDERASKIQTKYKDYVRKDIMSNVNRALDEDDINLLKEKATKTNSENKRVLAHKISDHIQIATAMRSQHFKENESKRNDEQNEQKVKNDEIVKKFRAKKIFETLKKKTENSKALKHQQKILQEYYEKEKEFAPNVNDSSRVKFTSPKGMTGPPIQDTYREQVAKDQALNSSMRGKQRIRTHIRYDSDSDKSSGRSENFMTPAGKNPEKTPGETPAKARVVPTVIATKLDDLYTETDFARVLGKETNKHIIETNADSIISAHHLLSNEKGKAIDKLPEETFNLLKQMSFLNINKATTSPTLFKQLDTLMSADVMISKNSPFVVQKAGKEKKQSTGASAGGSSKKQVIHKQITGDVDTIATIGTGRGIGSSRI